MSTEKFPKRRMLNRLDDVDATLRTYFRALANGALPGNGLAEQKQNTDAALELDRISRELNEIRMAIRQLELP